MWTFLYIIHIHKHCLPHTDTHQAFHLFSSDQILALQSTGPLLWTDVLRSLWGNDKCRLKSVAKASRKDSQRSRHSCTKESEKCLCAFSVKALEMNDGCFAELSGKNTP